MMFQVKAPLREAMSPSIAIVTGLTVLAGLLRFATLDAQSFGADEAVTAGVVLDHNFIQMLREVAGGESTPPLYYVTAWFWSNLFGTGEVGLRTLSALIGTALVPVAYALGTKLASRRVGLVLCSLVAVNPMLVWYSQEARAYSLLALTSAASVLLFAYALESPTRRRLVLWAVVSALTLATHYFGFLIVGAEAIWLVWTWRRRRDVWMAVAGLTAAGLALAPLAIYQTREDRTGWITEIPLGDRLQEAGEQFLAGPSGDQVAHVVPVAVALAGVGLVLVAWRAEGGERYGARLAALLGLSVVLVPLGLTLVGADRVLDKNLLPALVPFALVVAVGLGARRSGLLGPAVAAGLCLVSIVVVIRVAESPELQRTDYRGAAELIRAGPSAAVIAPANANAAFKLYLNIDHYWDDPPVKQLVVVGWWDSAQISRSFRGFEPTEERKLGTLEITRLRSDHPRHVQEPALTRLEPAGLSFVYYGASTGDGPVARR